MTHDQCAVRRLSRLLLAASLAAVVLGSGCELFGRVPGHHIRLLNSGRDPIHVGSKKCPQNEKTFIAALGGNHEETVEYSLSRNDINLGKLRVWARKVARDESGEDVTITMTEPVYFDFHFESNMSALVEVTYIKP